MKFCAVLLVVGTLSVGAYAQRPRTMDPAKGDAAQSTPEKRGVLERLNTDFALRMQ